MRKTNTHSLIRNHPFCSSCLAIWENIFPRRLTHLFEWARVANSSDRHRNDIVMCALLNGCSNRSQTHAPKSTQWSVQSAEFAGTHATRVRNATGSAQHKNAFPIRGAANQQFVHNCRISSCGKLSFPCGGFLVGSQILNLSLKKLG